MHLAQVSSRKPVLKGCAVQHPPLKHVGLEGLDEFQGAAHADPKGVHARFKALQITALENANQGMLPPQFKVIAFDVGLSSDN